MSDGTTNLIGCLLICYMQQQIMHLTDLEPNIEYKLGLTIYNGIRTHLSQRTIRIHLHVSNLTRVRLKCGPELCTSNIAFSI